MARGNEDGRDFPHLLTETLQSQNQNMRKIHEIEEYRCRKGVNSFSIPTKIPTTLKRWQSKIIPIVDLSGFFDSKKPAIKLFSQKALNSQVVDSRFFC